MNSDFDIFREWDLYHRIGHADAMRHQAIAETLRDALGERPAPLRVLDLGCGDGLMAQLVFADTRVAEFIGVDLSASALDRMRQRRCPGRTPETVRRTLICADIAASLRAMPDRNVDIVFASFSLHHYQTRDKPAVLDDAVRLLDKDGWLIWIDTMVAEGESRAAFLDRLASDISHWNGISIEERNSVIDHVRNCDYPETEAWMIDTMARRGCGASRTLYRDDLYCAILFQPPR